MANFDYDLYGRVVTHFRQSRRFAMNTSQAAGPLWEFRWGDVTTPGSLALVNRVTLKAVQTANATAEELRFNLKAARNCTAVDPTNTTSILRTSGNQQQVNSHQHGSILTDFRESSAATAAAGGTYTLDTDPFVSGSFISIATASTTFSGGSYGTIFDFSPLADNEQPLILRLNEGWAISLEVTKGATQGIVLFMECAWSEILPKIDV